MARRVRRVRVIRQRAPPTKPTPEGLDGWWADRTREGVSWGDDDDDDDGGGHG